MECANERVEGNAVSHAGKTWRRYGSLIVEAAIGAGASGSEAHGGLRAGRDFHTTSGAGTDTGTRAASVSREPAGRCRKMMAMSGIWRFWHDGCSGGQAEGNWRFS